MPLRNHLLLVVLAGLVPVVLFASITGYLLVQEQRVTFRRGAEERSLAMLSAVDAQLSRAIDAIQVLSKSESLNRGDMPLFRITAQRVLETQPDWITITVALPSGQRVMDLVAAPGEALPLIDRVEDSFERVLQAREPVIGNLANGMATEGWSYAVRTVVMQGDTVRYVLTAVVSPAAMGRLVEAQDLPEGWVGVVLDANNRFVARSADVGGSLGELPSIELQEALARGPGGLYRWTTGEGIDVFTAYNRSAASGWTFALGVPASTITAPTTRAYAVFVIGLLGAVVLAFVFARIVGRRIAGPIATLAEVTDGLRRGERVNIPQDFSVAEIGQFARTLAESLTALQEREQRLQLALNAGQMGTWEWDLRSNEVFWSTDMEAMHGFAPGFYSGRASGSYDQFIHPDDRMLVQKATLHGLETGEHQVEYRVLRPDGSQRWFEGRGKVIRDAAGAPVRMLGLCIDITTRKEAEKVLQESELRFREIANTAPAILWITDPNGSVSFFSRGWFEYTGQTQQQAFDKDGFGWLDAVHPDDRENAARIFREATVTREAFAFDYRLCSGSGTYRWALDAGKPRFDAAHKFLGFVGAVIDIDDRKRAEEALRTADRHKDDFLATLSHELRNPLAALTTSVHVLRATTPIDSRDVAVHGVIERQTQHMVRLVEDLLDITRIRLGKVSLRKMPVDLGALVADVTNARRTAGEFEFHAEVTLDTAPVMIEADAARIEQVYTNLLDNALKFTPAHGTIQVNVRQEGSCAVLTVRDTGQGISAENLSRIFDLFVQGDQSPGGTQGGLGLGLALVRRLVELHGGSVIADSAGQGKGALFTVSLPVIEVAGKTPRAKDAPASIAPLKVLLVEDNADVRYATRAYLEMEGHTLRDAATGADGLAEAESFAPDVVLLDIGLPDMDGYEVAQCLRAAQGTNTPILIAVSGHGEDRERTRAAGFDAHIIKPANMDELVRIIKELTEERALVS